MYALRTICFYALLLIPSLKSERYVVDTDNCRIIDPDPLNPDVMQGFHRLQYKPCTTRPPMTYVEYNETMGLYELKINETSFQWYLNTNLETNPTKIWCCYMYVLRHSEDQYKLSNCTKFQHTVLLDNDRDSFIVKCRDKDKLIYTNGHATVPRRNEIRQRLEDWKEKDAKNGGQRAPSVLMIAIDTVSRLNLMRAMPKTYEYLQSSGWFELAGYNKIGENTFPNAMAFLTGYNLERIEKKCNPKTRGGLNKCKFIWDQFQDLGYVTAYGEDDVSIHTFNYKKYGFTKPPVDYYMRPYMMAAEALLTRNYQRDVGNLRCLGHSHDFEHIYSYSLEFARQYRNDSFFGLFWTNTHSHGTNFSLTSSMDTYILEYLERFVSQGTMENTVVVLLSDHGIRSGPSRSNPLGWLEDRLPFLFIWLPPYLRESHPEFVHALKLNRNRLTNPFDLHLTLKHLLALSNRINVLELGGARDCPQCQSLLLPVASNRSCEDVAIPPTWCSCGQYRAANETTNLHEDQAMKVIKKINKLPLKDCAKLTLKDIIKVMIKIPSKMDDPNVTTHILYIKTSQNDALYEATIVYNNSSQKSDIIGLYRLDVTGENFCGKIKIIC